MAEAMTDQRIPNYKHGSEKDFVAAISDELRKMRWHVQLNPRVGSWRPDLIAGSPSGPIFVVECKFTRSEVDFSTIDYLLTVADNLRSQDPHVAVHPVLIATTPVRGIVERVSRDSGVQVMQASQGPTALAKRLANEAEGLAKS